MKKLSVFLFFLFTVWFGYSQPGDLKGFKMAGKNPVKKEINQTMSQSSELQLFGTAPAKIYGLAVSGQVTFDGDDGVVRVILVDKNYREYLVYEMYPLMADGNTVNIDELSEETCLLDGVTPDYLKVVVGNAILKLNSYSVASEIPQGMDISGERKLRKREQDNQKINKLNENLRARGLSWVAGETPVSGLFYEDRQKLYGQSTFPTGIEFYTGGVIQAGPPLKAATASLYVSQWDWRKRHGKDWVTKVTDQGNCGSCWAFAATGATEAAVNLFFNNETIDPDLSEQDVLSCSAAGSCSGGWPDLALNYIANTGIVDEEAFPYTATNSSCSEKNSSPKEIIKIKGKIGFGSITYPKTEDNLKAMIIKYGPLSGGVTNWSHALVLVGWKVVAAGDHFYTRTLTGEKTWIEILPGSSLIGTTVWLFKNSWGADWGDNGYVYVQSAISNIGYTYGLLTPVTSFVSRSVACVDNDRDGFYWWGTGPKPASCPTCPDTPDGNDSDNTLGPLDAYGYCTPITVVNPPAAEFTASPLILVAGNQVTFTDLSSNSPTAWSWSFPGGTPGTSDVQNPVVTYNTPGIFDVSLAATNQTGTGATTSKSGYITVTSYPAPVAAFTASTTSLTAGGSVNFTDQSTNNPTSWAWTFQGGSPASSTAQNPTVTYSTAGTYDVSLTVTNGGGSNTLSKTDYIAVSSVTYCTSHGNAAYEYISSVKLGSTTYFSESSGSAGYMNLTANSFTVTPGSSITLSLTPGYSGAARSEYWCVWIDYNGDNDFTDSNEKVFNASRKSGTVSGKFRTPAGLNLTTRMRVSMKQTGAPSSCETFSFGEVKDYHIRIAPASSGLKNAITELPKGMKLYPNPVSDKLSILLDESMTGSGYVIFNSLGVKVTSGTIANKPETLDLSGFIPGLYLITVQSADVILKDKFIKH